MTSLLGSAPTFPHLNQLVHPKTFELVDPPVAGGRREQGLLDGLLGGDVSAIYQDAIEHPEKYDDQTIALLTQLMHGQRKRADLTEAERGLLEHAVITFSSYVPPKKAPKFEPPAAPPMQKFAEEEDEEFSSGSPIPGIDVPETDTPAYWWL